MIQDSRKALRMCRVSLEPTLRSMKPQWKSPGNWSRRSDVHGVGAATLTEEKKELLGADDISGKGSDCQETTVFKLRGNGLKELLISNLFFYTQNSWAGDLNFHSAVWCPHIPFGMKSDRNTAELPACLWRGKWVVHFGLVEWLEPIVEYWVDLGYAKSIWVVGISLKPVWSCGPTQLKVQRVYLVTWYGTCPCVLSPFGNHVTEL